MCQNVAAKDYVFQGFVNFLKKYEFWRRGLALWLSRGRLATPSTRFRWCTLSLVHANADARFRIFRGQNRFKTMWDISCRGGRQRVIFGTYSQIMLATRSKDVKGTWLCENDNIFTICSKFSVCPPRKWNIPIPASRQRKIEQNDLYLSISKLLMTC